MNDPHLTVDLSYTGSLLLNVQAAAFDLVEVAQLQLDEVDSVSAAVSDLAERLGLKKLDEVADETPDASNTESHTLEDARSRVASKLKKYDSAGSIDDLLDAELASDIDEFHGGVFDGRIELDGYDIAASVLAGAVGALTDLLVVRIPTGGKWNGEWQPGSRLTFALRKHALDNENWLSGLAKAPFDRVVGTGIEGMGPRSHRVQTFGHDPLLGWTLGTMDIMRGTLTGVSTSSELRVVDIGGATPNLLAVLSLQVAHLLSDVFTHMGLPLPGWTALVAIPHGSFGPDNLSVGAMARWMYLRGYGAWHLATMATSVATTEAVIRSYYALRQLGDDDYENRVSAERIRAGAGRVSDEPRYRSLSLLAHSVATAGNAGKLILAGGNPLALNIAQWSVLGRKLIQNTRTQSTPGFLVAQHAANLKAIHVGWSELKVDLTHPIGI